MEGETRISEWPCFRSVFQSFRKIAVYSIKLWVVVLFDLPDQSKPFHLRMDPVFRSAKQCVHDDSFQSDEPVPSPAVRFLPLISSVTSVEDDKPLWPHFVAGWRSPRHTVSWFINHSSYLRTVFVGSLFCVSYHLQSKSKIEDHVISWSLSLVKWRKVYTNNLCRS